MNDSHLIAYLKEYAYLIADPVVHPAVAHAMCARIKEAIALDDAEDHAHCKEQVLSARRGSAEGTLFENEKKSES